MMIDGGGFIRAAKGHETSGIGCEDCALVDWGRDSAVAVICDGCSSGVDSGFAARALGRSALAVWRETSGLDESGCVEAVRRAALAMESVGLDPLSSPATLLCACVDVETGNGTAFFWGDGVAAIFGEGGGVVAAWMGESGQNMPAYPIYGLAPDSWDSYDKAGGVCQWRPLLDPASPKGVLIEGRRHWRLDFNLLEGESLCLASDGAVAVDGVSALDFLNAMSKARGPGNFIGRRARAAVEAWRSEESSLGDDLGVCALRRTRGRMEEQRGQ